MPTRNTPIAAEPKDADLNPIRVRTMADQAADRLRNAIQRGSLAPGVALVERDLADKLGMSRVPIREAIQRLVDEGLVRKTAHRATIVYLPSPREIEEITSVRIVLEHLVTERVLDRWSPQVESELRAIVDEMRPAVEVRDRRRLVETDAKFHAAMWRVADHIVLEDVIGNLRQRVNRLLFETFSLMTDDQLAVTISSHETLIRVFKRGNVQAAKNELTRHVTDAKDRILAAYQAKFANIEEQG